MRTLSSSPSIPTPHPVPALGPGAPSKLGRPSGLTPQMLDLLCAVIREMGCSDSAAAARSGVHPSTVSRWKRDCPDVAILLRTAREEFRMAQLSVILAEAGGGKARSWRAAAWLLERIFPEDYSPRAKERALFQAQHEALCASEGEATGLALPDEGEALQNVQKSDGAETKVAAEAAALKSMPGAPVPAPLLQVPLQNVRKAVLSGPIQPPREVGTDDPHAPRTLPPFGTVPCDDQVRGSNFVTNW